MFWRRRNDSRSLEIRFWNLIVCAVAGLFSLAVSALVHDSFALNQPVSSQTIQTLVSSSRPLLFDVLGQPMKLHSARDYQEALLRGGFRSLPHATIAMAAPDHSISFLAVNQAPQALLEGWTIEPLNEELMRIIYAKQDQGMWLGRGEDLWFQSSLCYIGALLLFSSILIANELSADISEE